MDGTLTGRVGFARLDRGALAPRRYLASLQLVTSVALLVSTVVAVAIVSIGIARAAPVEAAEATGHALSIAILLGLILAGWGWLTAFMARRN